MRCILGKWSVPCKKNQIHQNVKRNISRITTTEFKMNVNQAMCVLTMLQLLNAVDVTQVVCCLYNHSIFVLTGPYSTLLSFHQT